MKDSSHCGVTFCFAVTSRSMSVVSLGTWGPQTDAVEKEGGKYTLCTGRKYAFLILSLSYFLVSHLVVSYLFVASLIVSYLLVSYLLYLLVSYLTVSTRQVTVTLS